MLILKRSKFFLVMILTSFAPTVYFKHNPSENLFYSSLLITLLLVFLFMIVTLNYILYSRLVFRVVCTENTFAINGENINVNEITSVKKFQSYPDEKYSAYPWRDGMYYYYYLSTKDENYLITSFVINDEESILLERILKDRLEVVDLFMPLIRKKLLKK